MNTTTSVTAVSRSTNDHYTEQAETSPKSRTRQPLQVNFNRARFFDGKACLNNAYATKLQRP
jgi:hypothetical protein